jgi:hypothetical protein
MKFVCFEIFYITFLGGQFSLPENADGWMDNEGLSSMLPWCCLSVGDFPWHLFEKQRNQAPTNYTKQNMKCSDFGV